MTYDNECKAKAACQYEGSTKGACCKPKKGMFCTMEHRPVCGEDGKTYTNKCFAMLACQQRWTLGACCKAPDTICTEDYTPVCGEDGMTYGNQCKAKAACQFDGSTPGPC